MIFPLKVLEFVQDGLNSTIARYGGNATADGPITDAWDTIQDSVSAEGGRATEGVG